MMATETEAAKPDAKDTKTESKTRYKYCAVPECKSTTFKTPEKLFFSIPTGELRGAWCEAMGRRPPTYKPLSPMCNRFCCEDHFDLEKDMLNYIQWKLMGRKGTSKLHLKKGVFPHKFDCRREKTEATDTQQVEKKSVKKRKQKEKKKGQKEEDSKETIKDIPEQGQQKEMDLDQRLIEVKKKQAEKKYSKETIKDNPEQGQKKEMDLDQRLIEVQKKQVEQKYSKETIKDIPEQAQKKEMDSDQRMIEVKKKQVEKKYSKETIKDIPDQGQKKEMDLDQRLIEVKKKQVEKKYSKETIKDNPEQGQKKEVDLDQRLIEVKKNRDNILKHQITEKVKAQQNVKVKSKTRYKYCSVPECKNTTLKTPEKLFFSIPTGELRGAWCEAMGRRPPTYEPLSPMCNRFCCEDHFDLEKDMLNYLQWKLMGKMGTTKLRLKKGVIPHKFDCRCEKTEATNAHQVEKKYSKETMKDIPEKARLKEMGVALDQEKAEAKNTQKVKKKYRKKFVKDIPEQAQKKEMGVVLDQRIIEVKKHRVNILKRLITEKVKPKQNLRDKKLPLEEEEILDQKKKIDKISQATQTINETKEQDIETYTFHIKIEAEDNYEPNDGDSRLGELHPQGFDTAGEYNSHLLDVNVKIEELDEEFEPELVESEQENIIEDEADATRATEMIPVLMESSTPVINLTNHLIKATSDDNKDDTQEIIKETANSLSTKTNNFVITENIREKEVFERVIIGKQIKYVVEDEIKNTL